MTAPIREQILSAVKNRLLAISGIPGLAVDRNKDASVQKFPALIILDGDHSADAGTAFGKTEYEMKADIEGYVKSASSDDVGPDLNILYAKTIQALMQDITLGGIAIDINEIEMTTQIDRSEGRQPVGAFSLAINIKFATAPGDPFTLAS